MEKWKLPQGWEWQPISTIADDTERRNPAHAPNEFFSYVDIGSIDNKNGIIDESLVKRVKGENAPSRARKVIKANAVIFATTRPYLKNIAIVPEVLDDEICSTGFCVLLAKPNKGFPKFIYYAVRSQFFIDQLSSKQRGANYPAVTDGDVFQSEIPIPYPNDPARSLAEQRRIVARLEALLGEVREMRALAQSMQADIERVMEAALAEVFPRYDESLPAKWEWYRLGDVCRTTSGGTPRRSNPKYFGGSIPWVKSGELKDGIVTESTEHITEEGLRNSNAKVFPKSTLLIAMYGATVGRLGILGIEAATNQAVCAIFPPETLSNKYLFWFLRSVRNQLTQRSFGGAQPNISQTVIRNLHIPIPYPDNPKHSLTEQRRIATYLDTIQEEEKGAQALIEQDLQAIEQLEQSILAAAFRGEV